jgi:hypothetical protein
VQIGQGVSPAMIAVFQQRVRTRLHEKQMNRVSKNTIYKTVLKNRELGRHKLLTENNFNLLLPRDEQIFDELILML